MTKWHQTQIVVGQGFRVTKENHIEISICGAINLTVGDTHVIWHSHKKNTERQRKDFERLFWFTRESAMSGCYIFI